MATFLTISLLLAALSSTTHMRRTPSPQLFSIALEVALLIRIIYLLTDAITNAGKTSSTSRNSDPPVQGLRRRSTTLITDTVSPEAVYTAAKIDKYTPRQRRAIASAVSYAKMYSEEALEADELFPKLAEVPMGGMQCAVM